MADKYGWTIGRVLAAIMIIGLVGYGVCRSSIDTAEREGDGMEQRHRRQREYELQRCVSGAMPKYLHVGVEPERAREMAISDCTQ